jgi:hypothetical protein
VIATDVAPMTKAELIAANLAHFITGLHHADPLTLQHEAERNEYLEPSPLVLRMRAQITAEQTARRAHQLLVDLGGTADAIADRLRALDVKGVRLLSNVCVLAVYLQTKGITAYVSREEIAVPVDDDTNVCLPVPDACAAFLEHFDGGVYLDLIDANLEAAALERAGA